MQGVKPRATLKAVEVAQRKAYTIIKPDLPDWTIKTLRHGPISLHEMYGRAGGKNQTIPSENRRKGGIVVARGVNPICQETVSSSDGLGNDSGPNST